MFQLAATGARKVNGKDHKRGLILKSGFSLWHAHLTCLCEQNEATDFDYDLKYLDLSHGPHFKVTKISHIYIFKCQKPKVNKESIVKLNVNLFVNFIIKLNHSVIQVNSSF